MTWSRRQWLGASALLAGLGMQASAAMRDRVTIVTGAGGGSISDALCRRVASQLAPGYAQQAQVENRTGAAGQQASNYVLGRPADGRTLLQTSVSALAPHVDTKRSSASLHDLTPVSVGAVFDFGFAVGPAVPLAVRNLREFFVWAKAQPEAANFASPAVASTAHCLGALLAQNAGVDLQHVAYRSQQLALLDIFAGNVAALIAPLGEILPQRAGAKLRVLGVSGARRSRFAPDVATWAEQGWADSAHSEYLAFFLPANAASEVVQGLNHHLRTALAAADVVDRLAVLAVQAQSSTPAELSELLRAEAVKWQLQRLNLADSGFRTT